MKYRTLKRNEKVKKGDIVKDEYCSEWEKADRFIGYHIGEWPIEEAKRPIHTRKRKSMEFRTFKRVCCYEYVNEICNKQVHDINCNAKNCPIWARLPEVK